MSKTTTPLFENDLYDLTLLYGPSRPCKLSFSTIYVKRLEIPFTPRPISTFKLIPRIVTIYFTHSRDRREGNVIQKVNGGGHGVSKKETSNRKDLK